MTLYLKGSFFIFAFSKSLAKIGPAWGRAEEFRLLLEQREILAKAIPIEERLGANLWQVAV